MDFSNYRHWKIVRDIEYVVKYFRTRLIVSVVLIIVLCAGTAVASAEFVITDVYCDNQVKKVVTFSADPDEIIAKSGFKAKEGQKVILDLFDANAAQSVIVIANPHEAVIYDGDKFAGTVTVTGTVADAIKAAGIKLKDGDELNYPETLGLTENLEIKIKRGFTVNIIVDGEKKKVKTAGGTVYDIIQKAGINLGAYDVVSKDKNEVIAEKTTIKIKRVQYKTTVKETVLKHSTKVNYDDSMYEDETVVKVQGENGKKTETFEEKYVDGELKKTTLISSVTDKEAVTQVVVRGTKVKPGSFKGTAVKSSKVMSELTPPFEIPLNQSGRPIEYKKVITGKATAYCTGSICSTGVGVKQGYVAVDPREIPYGTKMYIVSSDGRYNYGYCIAADTGGFIYNSSTVVDLYMYSYSQCRQFGRRNVDIYILEWGNGFGTKK